jgi:hypothetical protein
LLVMDSLLAFFMPTILLSPSSLRFEHLLYVARHEQVR